MTNLEPKPTNSEQATRLLLKIHSEFGCEWNVQNEPRGFYQTPTAKAETPVAKPTKTPEKAPTPAVDEAVLGAVEAIKQAEDIASKATDLVSLRAGLESFTGLESLSKPAENLVFADGVADSDIMIIGEAPGAEEDRIGKPFVGASGQLLDKMLSYIGLFRDKNFYITNTIFWRPAGNRDPHENELNICAPFVKRHIELVAPKILLLVGNIPTKQIFQTTKGITKMRGEWGEYDLGGAKIPMLATFHPAYLYHKPLAKREVWKDLLSFHAKLTELKIGAGGGT